MATKRAATSDESARDEYYAEMDGLELDGRLREAVSEARRSTSQQLLIDAWRRSAKTA